MAYTTSFLDTSYTVYANDRDTIERLRRELRKLSSDQQVSAEFQSQRSILSDSILLLSKDLSSIKETLITSSVSAAVSTLISATDGMTDEQIDAYLAGAGSVNSGIVRDFIDSSLSSIDSLSTRTDDVILSTGVLNQSFKVASRAIISSSRQTVLSQLSSIENWWESEGVVAVRQLLSGIKSSVESLDSTSIFNSLGSWWDGSVTPFFSDVLGSVERTASNIYNSFLVPIGTAVVDFFNSPFFTQRLSFDNIETPLPYLSQVLRDTSALIINQGIPTSLFRAAEFIIDLGVSGANFVGNLVSDGWERLLDVGVLRDTGVSGFLEGTVSAISNAGSNVINFITNFLPSGEVKNIISAVSDVLSIVAPNFEDGVTETRFGRAMENSWNIFLTDALSNGVNILPTTPLDPSFNENYNLYGNMMLGAPLGYTRTTDPNNRTMINTFVKDSVFLSLTPGMPKYNGGAFQQEVLNLFSGGVASSYLNQTPTSGEMRDYLFRNGLDEYFGNRDKRYYTFQTDYEEYFAYLETMLNTLWVKMGLGTNEDGSFDIFSFFDDGRENLSSRFRSSLGFYVNPVGDISENINSNTLSTDLADDANAASSQFQRLNYITGMGTAGPARNIMRQVGVASVQAGTLRNVLATNLSFEGSGLIAKGINLVKSVVDFANTQDISSIVQQFQVTNGMKVQYPQLWESSGYSKNMTFSFNFVSPYGDPLSIFQYVYVPFFSLLSFAMPRQAAENGLVSPFFVRADIPGWITSDLALVTDITWQRGGTDGTMWTKDKLPRAISGSFTVTDLYPYLAAVKRLSFLSANPSFTVFLDNMAGLRSLYNPNINTDPFAEYWKTMINRVNGDRKENNTLYNAFNDDRKSTNAQYSRTNRESISRTINKKSASWLSKV